MYRLTCHMSRDPSVLRAQRAENACHGPAASTVASEASDTGTVLTENNSSVVVLGAGEPRVEIFKGLDSRQRQRHLTSTLRHQFLVMGVGASIPVRVTVTLKNCLSQNEKNFRHWYNRKRSVVQASGFCMVCCTPSLKLIHEDQKATGSECARLSRVWRLQAPSQVNGQKRKKIHDFKRLVGVLRERGTQGRVYPGKGGKVCRGNLYFGQG